jgi:hypothetical protein
MASLLGAIIGAAIERRDGKAGLKGAIIGQSPREPTAL